MTLANVILLGSDIRSCDISKQAFTLLDVITASSANLVLEIPDDIIHCFYKVSDALNLIALYLIGRFLIGLLFLGWMC